MINEDLFTKLAADAGVASYLTSGSVTRIYPHKHRFEPTYPLVTYEVADDEPAYVFAGSIQMREANLVYTCVAETYREARQVADAIESALSGFRGLLTTHFAHAVMVDGVRDSKIQKTDDADSFYYAVSVSVTVSYE